MKFDEFSDKLYEVLSEFERDTGRKADTVKELNDYIKRRKMRVKGRRHLTSLKGLGL